VMVNVRRRSSRKPAPRGCASYRLLDERKDEKPRDVIGITIADQESYPTDPGTFPEDTIGTRSDAVTSRK
jgi:hypothetical protein